MNLLEKLNADITVVFHDVDADGMLAKEIILQNIPNFAYKIPYIHNKTNHLKLLDDVIIHHSFEEDHLKLIDGIYRKVNIILTDCYFNIEPVIKIILKELKISDDCIFNFLIIDHHISNAKIFHDIYCPDQDINKIYQSVEHFNSPFSCGIEINNRFISADVYYINGVCSAKIADLIFNQELYDNTENGIKYKENIGLGVVDYVNDIDVWNRELLPDSLELDIALKLENNILVDTNPKHPLSCNYGYSKFFKDILSLEKSGKRKGDFDWEVLFNTTKAIGKTQLNNSIQYGRQHADDWKIYNTPFGKGLLFFSKGYNLNTVSSEIYDVRIDADFVFSVVHTDYIKDKLTITFRSRADSTVRLGMECFKYSNGKGGGHDHAAGMTINYSTFRRFLGLEEIEPKI